MTVQLTTEWDNVTFIISIIILKAASMNQLTGEHQLKGEFTDVNQENRLQVGDYL